MAVLITRDFNGNEVRTEGRKRGRKIDSVSISIAAMKPGDEIEIIGSYNSAYSRCKTSIMGVENPPIFFIEQSGSMTCRIIAFERGDRVGVSCNRDMSIRAEILNR